MPTYAYETVDVFTDRRFGGNPLAVFTDARGMSDAQMQALAAEMNYSETTFVLPPEDPAHTARVRIFHSHRRNALRRPSQCRHGLRAAHATAATGTACCCSRNWPGWSRSRSSATAPAMSRVRRSPRRSRSRPGIELPARGHRGLCRARSCRYRRHGTMRRSRPRSVSSSCWPRSGPRRWPQALPDVCALPHARGGQSGTGEAASRCSSMPARVRRSGRGCSRRSPAPGRIRRPARPAPRSPRCCSRSMAATAPASRLTQGIEMGRPSLLNLTRAARRRRHPRDGWRRLRYRCFVARRCSGARASALSGSLFGSLSATSQWLSRK